MVSNLKKSPSYIKLCQLCEDSKTDPDILIEHYEEIMAPGVGRDHVWDFISDSNTKLHADLEVAPRIIDQLEKLHEEKADAKKRPHRKSNLTITGKLNEAANAINADVDELTTLYQNNWRKGITHEVMRSHLTHMNGHLKAADLGMQDKIIKYLRMVFEGKQGRDWKINLNENREAKIEIPDLFFTDDNGRERINWTTLREFVQQTFIFKTLLDTDELLVYKNGIYVDARNTVRNFIHTIKGVDDSASKRIVQELIEHIKARTGVEREIFNVDTNYLPVKNGLYNFETQELEDFDPEKYYTFQLPVKYDPTATHEATTRFIGEVAEEGDFDVLQEIFGYCLYSEYPSHHFFWLYGTGRNGKGVYSALLSAMIGEKNKASVSIAQLDGQQRFATARLMGKLLNVVPESNNTRGIEVEVLKAMTGQDMIGGEKKGVQEPFNFINFAKFLIHSNAFPRIEDTSDAFWDRAIPIPFNKKFSGVTDKKNYWKDIVKEDTLSGIINYALKGFYRLRDNNWEFTASVTQDKLKGNMRRMAQPTQTFQDQWTDLNNRAVTSADRMYSAMQLYCDDYGIVPPSEREFIRDISSAHGVIKKRDESGDFDRKLLLMGIRLKKEIHVRMSLEAFSGGSDKEKVKDEPIEPLTKDARELLER